LEKNKNFEKIQKMTINSRKWLENIDPHLLKIVQKRPYSNAD
jgi:hypothetical protein